MKLAVRIVLLFSLFVSYNGSAQNTVNHHVDFASGLQSMWGPNGTNFSINQTIPLIPTISWNESFDVNGIVNAPLGLGSFGAAIDGFFSGSLGCNFSLEGFTLGQVEVDYPIDITLDMPNDQTYDQGDDIVIDTEYELAPGYALETMYPNAGEAKLDLFFSIGLGLSAEVCLFGCANFTMIPSFTTPVQNINIFTLDGSPAAVDGDGLEATFFSLNGGTPLISYPDPFPLTTDLIPGDPLGQFGLSGSLNLPYVSTTDGANGLDLIACGESPYINMNLDIFGLLSNLPIPGAAALGYLSGTQDLGFGAYVYWNFLSASIDVNVVNKQCFTFSPKVYGDFEFPVPVEYQIIDQNTGAMSARDTSSLIRIEIGDDLLFKFPCYFEDIDITPTYSIDGVFTNRTYDSIPVDFLFSAFGFGLVIPEIELIPAIVTPELCIGYPCGWFDWCTSCWDPPDIPAVTIDPPDFLVPSDGSAGLIDLSIPITSIEYNWFNDTWSLAGFDTYTFPSFGLTASLLGISNIKNDILCYGDNSGSIDITTTAISPATPYTYSWTNGATSQDLSNLTAGPYEVSVFDANGCQLVTGATIIEPQQPLSVSPTITEKSCNGGVNDGEIDLFVQGGTPPYTYAWSTGASTEDVTGLNAGTYTVTVTDNNGCTETMSIDVTEPDVLGQVGIVNHVLCTNSNTGTIDADVYGGVLPYTYAWDNGETTQDIDSLLAGNYTLTITDGNLCQNQQTYVINEPANEISGSSIATDVLCYGDSTGSIDVTLTGGTGLYTYEWSSDQGIVLPYQTEDLTNIPSSEYFLNVTDENGCEFELSQVVNQPAAPITTNPVLTDVDCNGSNTGSIVTNLAGGSTPYTISWNNGATTADLNNIVAGDYTISVTDNSGCTFTESYSISEPEALMMTFEVDDVLCFGESTGSIETTVSGGTPNYTYSWDGVVGTNINSGLLAGTYVFEVVDGNGCILTQNIDVNQPAAPLNVTYNTVDVLCYGENTGSIEALVTGGTSPYYYQWSTNGSVILIDTLSSISNMYAANYLLTVTDENGCILNSSEAINQPNAPISLSANTVNVSCFGGADGSIDLSVTGGTGPYIYNWSNGQTIQDITGLSAGNYTVVVTDNNGCSASLVIAITEPSEALVVSLNQSDVTCKGGADGYVETTVTGGTGTYAYLWSNGETTEHIYNLSIGSYSVTVTDENGCLAFTGTVINEPATAVSVTWVETPVSCFGGSDGELTITPSGGVLPYSYDWGNQGEILMAEESETLSGLNIGDYVIQVEDGNGCFIETIMTVTQPPLLTASSTHTDVYCYGDSTGTIDVTVEGGTPPYYFEWDDGTIAEDVTGLAAGWHVITITDYNGCTVMDSAEILQPSMLWNTYTITGLSCEDQNDAYIGIDVDGGVPPYYYVWSNGSTDDEIYNLASGTYYLIYMDDNGCSDTLEFLIEPSDVSCLNIPNTFTPNGDNYNDTWIIENIELYPEAVVIVFNKWGNEIYRTEGEYIPWDGTHRGGPLPAESYYYIIELNNSGDYKYTGVITIVR